MAETFAELGVTWFEEPVSSDDLEGLRLLRERARAGMDDRRRRIRLRCLLFPPHARRRAVDVLAGRRHALRRDHRLPAGGRAVRGPRRCRFRRTLRAALHLHAGLRASRPAAHRIFPRSRPDRADAVRRRVRSRATGALRPDLSRPGLGLELKRPRTPRAMRPERSDANQPDRTCPTAQADKTARSARPCTARVGSRARSASTTAAARSMRPTPRTTGRCRSAWSCRGRRRRGQRPSRLCREHGAPILSRGGGTSLAGQCCNVAVVHRLLASISTRVVEIDAERRRARVQPGCVLDTLRERRRASPSDLRSRSGDAQPLHAGGMIGNNSCGVHSRVWPGRTADNVEELDILTYDGMRLPVGPTSEDELERSSRQGGRRGEIYRRLEDSARPLRRRDPRSAIRDIPRRVSGYNLDELLPENGLQRRARAGRLRRHLRHVWSRR